ncbi:MAG: hypothetical protein LBL13_00325 [Bacteroidales bacterium]|jgi:hypothetical protein|nr:hypothetical protein [Bacteroidales bacterium]
MKIFNLHARRKGSKQQAASNTQQAASRQAVKGRKDEGTKGRKGERQQATRNRQQAGKP